MKRLILLPLSLLFLLSSSPAQAIEPPSRKPNPPYTSSVLPRQEFERVYLALRAASDGDWREVERYRSQVTDPVANKLLFWRVADSSLSGADFATLDRALSALQDWPGTFDLQVRAEEQISDSALSPQERIAWLERSGPISGEGKIALAEAYQAVGRRTDAEAMVRSAWHGHPFLISRQREIANKFAEILDPQDHIVRADYLLWSSQRSAAQAMKSYLPSGWDSLVDARIALATGAGGVDTLINRVPANLQSNPGLLYERSNWRRHRGRWEDAREPLLAIDPAGVPERGLRQIWDERNLHLRRAIRDHEWRDAYFLAANHGLSEGGDFAEGEFFAGWVALRYLDEPEVALRHFQRLENGVTTAISLSRARFWVGEAYTALGQTNEARAAYQRAMQDITYFYGQLAAQRLGINTITLPPAAQPTAADRERFESLELVKALRILAEAGEDYQFRRISYHLDDLLQTEAEYALLYELASGYQLRQVGVRGAKAGVSKGIIAPNAAFPTFDFQIPASRSSMSADPALISALTRQETEMNAKAISSARAYGLMQLLDGTARAQARRENVSYRQSWLLDDPEYNVTLGRSYLGDMIDRFDGSYIMAIAAYNAGPSRPARWIEEYGDPRRGEIDPIDWIESIPFSETRNYVQRVLENTQVYRYMLAGGPAPLELTSDLSRGH